MNGQDGTARHSTGTEPDDERQDEILRGGIFDLIQESKDKIGPKTGWHGVLLLEIQVRDGAAQVAKVKTEAVGRYRARKKKPESS